MREWGLTVGYGVGTHITAIVGVCVGDMGRALGSLAAKGLGVTAEPDIVTRALMPEDRFLVPARIRIYTLTEKHRHDTGTQPHATRTLRRARVHARAQKRTHDTGEVT